MPGPTAVTSRERTRAALVSLVGNYAGSILAIIKGIIFVPLYFRILGADVYGAWLASGGLVGVLELLDAGISSAVYQRLGESWGAGDRSRFTRTVGAAGLILLTVAALLVTLGVTFAPFVPRLVQAPRASWTVLSLAFVFASCGAAGSILIANLAAVSAAWQRPAIGATTRIVGQLIETATIGVGLWIGWGVLALAIGSVTGAAASLIVGGLWTRLHWRRFELGTIRVRGTDLRELGQAVAPLMLGRIVLQIDANIEVTLVSILMNPTLAAVYAITDRILHMAISFISPIAGASISGLSHLVGEKGRGAALRPARELISVWSLVITATFPVLLVLNQDFTILWVGRNNYGGVGLNVALFLSELLGGREWLFSVLLLSSGAIAASAWISTAESLIRMPLMYLALLGLGWIGLPGAQALVSAVFLVIYSRLVAKQLSLASREQIGLLLQGFGPLLLSFLLAIVEIFLLPHARSWAMLTLKGASVGAAHLTLTLVLSPTGRGVFIRRLAHALPESWPGAKPRPTAPQ